VARSTRQQRRQRRAQAAGTPPLRPATKPRPTAEEEPREPKESQVERPDDVRPGVRGFRFFQESWAELKKVEWPNQQQLVSGTAVVIVACLITGAYLYLNDQVWQFVVEHLFLR
jgi:preprotein translocase subunit SecE